MALHISAERIAEKDLTDYEIEYLQARNRLPKDYYDDPEAGLGASPTIAEPGGIDDDDEEEEDYIEGWNNDQRRAELTRRKLSIDGKMDELIARLRRSDMGESLDEDFSALDD